MARPASLPDLAAVIRRSRLVDGPQLDGVLDKFRGKDETPSRLLDRLIADGLLTRFQADQLAEGRWRGFEVGGYTLLDRLGGGGMGQVYLAEHPAGDRQVAVKVLTDELADDAVALERFAREARAVAALAHPNIVEILDVNLEADPPFLVMQYIDGVSLQAAVARSGTFSAGAAAHCGRQVALALERAAAVGLVHRDIKPANVLVDRSGQVKVLDFGVVRIADERGLNLTRRTVLGTADYLAPEQARDSSNVDARADLYALGGTLYFLLAGHPPFPEGTQTQKLHLKQSTDPRPVGELRPDLPAGLAAVVHRLLARDPGDRYPNPRAAAEALAPFATPDPHFPQSLFDFHPSTLTDLHGAATPPGGVQDVPTGPRTAPVDRDSQLHLRRSSRLQPTVQLPRPGGRWRRALVAAAVAVVTALLAWVAWQRLAPLDPHNRPDATDRTDRRGG